MSSRTSRPPGQCTSLRAGAGGSSSPPRLEQLRLRLDLCNLRQRPHLRTGQLATSGTDERELRSRRATRTCPPAALGASAPRHATAQAGIGRGGHVRRRDGAHRERRRRRGARRRSGGRRPRDGVLLASFEVPCRSADGQEQPHSEVGVAAEGDGALDGLVELELETVGAEVGERALLRVPQRAERKVQPVSPAAHSVLCRFTRTRLRGRLVISLSVGTARTRDTFPLQGGSARAPARRR
jgi:hypothetical protein